MEDFGRSSHLWWLGRYAGPHRCEGVTVVSVVLHKCDPRRPSRLAGSVQLPHDVTEFATKAQEPICPTPDEGWRAEVVALPPARCFRGTTGGPAIDKTLIDPTVVPDAAVGTRCL